MGCCGSSSNYVCMIPMPQSNNGVNEHFIRQSSNIRDFYIVIKTIGTGKLGSILLIRDKRYGIERVAKEIIKDLVNENFIDKLEHDYFLLKNTVIST